MLLSRRSFGACAICAITGFIASEAHAEDKPAPAAATAGVKRNIVQKTDLPDSKYVSVLAIVEIDGGTVVARHTHPGVESTYVLDGQLELMVHGQPARTVKAGDAFQIAPEVPHAARNGEKVTKLAITYTVDRDKPLASPAPE
jgi:quercetin dioxygenase-like cupin family protein